MNTAGGNDAKHEWEKWLDALKEQAARDGASLRDPSVRDVLAQLDRIEGKIDTLAAVAATWLREQDAHA